MLFCGPKKKTLRKCSVLRAGSSTLLWPGWEDQYLAVPEPDKSAEISLCCSEPSAHLWLRLLHGNKRCFQLQLRLWVHLSSGPSVVWGCLHQISASLSRVLARLGMMNNFTLAPLPSTLRSSGLCWSPSCCSSNSSFSPPTLPSICLSLFFFFALGWMFSARVFSYHPNLCMSKRFLNGGCKQRANYDVLGRSTVFLQKFSTDCALHCAVLFEQILGWKWKMKNCNAMGNLWFDHQLIFFFF